MSQPFDYFLFTRPENPLIKPLGFHDRADIVRHLHLKRGAMPIDVEDRGLQLDGEPSPRDGASIWLLSEDGARVGYLGWAFLKGAGAETLRAALAADQQNVIRRHQAA